VPGTGWPPSLPLCFSEKKQQKQGNGFSTLINTKNKNQMWHQETIQEKPLRHEEPTLDRQRDQSIIIKAMHGMIQELDGKGVGGKGTCFDGLVDPHYRR
jgi:hypothetical protein